MALDGLRWQAIPVRTGCDFRNYRLRVTAPFQFWKPGLSMRLFRHFTELPASVRGGVVALGNFDGVHLGHQAVTGAAMERARALGVASGVMTFEPHPRSLFAPDT